MKKDNLSKDIKPVTVFAVIGAFILFIILGVFLYFRNNTAASVNEDQIMIERGGKKVIVNENGIVEYRTGNGTYYDYWDSDTTKNFFSYVRQKAEEYLESGPGQSESDDGYYITLYLDGKEVKIWVSGDDEIISEVFEVEEEDLSSGGSENESLSDYFDDFFNPSPTVYFNLPTPTINQNNPDVVSAQGGGTTPGGSTNPTPPVDCSLYDSQVTGRTIISNTLCVED